MGFFDGLRKDKKQAEPVQQEQRVQEDTVEDEIAIEHIEVVERDPHSSSEPEPQPAESRPEIEPTPIRSYRDKKPVKHVVGPLLQSTFPPRLVRWASRCFSSILILRVIPRAV